MKWILLSVAIVGVLPLAIWLRSHPRDIPKIWMLVGFLAFEHGPLHTYMALDSWAGQWSGYIQGAEISLLDLIMLAIYLSLPRGGQPIPFLYPMAFYFLAALLSVSQASIPMAALFYSWQLARVFFFYAVVAKTCAADDRVVPSMLKGLAAGLFLVTCHVLWERFGVGMNQTQGGFGHQNFLGLVSHFVVYPFFALLLAREKSWLPILVSVAGALIAVLTASRATLAVAIFGYGLVFIISALRGWTSHKAKIMAAGMIAVVALMPVAVSSFEKRFADRGEDSSSFFDPDEVRVQMAEAAQLILSDHPLGVGANHYVLSANLDGYNVKAGLSWANNNAYVHNVYWLVAAETGYLGLITFIIVLLRPLTVAFLCGWRNRKDKRGDLLIGLGVGLLTVYLHSFYEWVLITFEAQYLFAASAGMVAGLAQQLGYWRRTQPVRIARDELAQTAPNAASNFRIKSTL